MQSKHQSLKGIVYYILLVPGVNHVIEVPFQDAMRSKLGLRPPRSRSTQYLNRTRKVQVSFPMEGVIYISHGLGVLFEGLVPMGWIINMRKICIRFLLAYNVNHFTWREICVFPVPNCPAHL